MASQFDKYIVIQKFGKDKDNSFGILYLVEKEENGIKKAYVKKILKDNKESICSNRDLFDHEIDIINKLADFKDNIYTPVIYAYKKYNISDNKSESNENNINNKEKIKIEANNIGEKPFYIIDYFSKGSLFYYTRTGKLLEQKHSKFLFKKIVEGFRFIHSKNICHLDIKPENIVLDKNFKPIIIDFGFSEEINSDTKTFTGSRGSKHYKCPEMWENKEYNGIQSDIFSLGVVLFNIVSGSFGFFSSETNDEYYQYIANSKGDFTEYWKLVENTVQIKFTDEFKKLYVKMVAYNPSERPKIDEILSDPWLKEINDEKEKDKLELVYQEEISKIYNNIKTVENKEMNISDKIISEFLTRNNDVKKGAFTNENIKPKKIPYDRILINHFIKINGNLKELELDFMNDLVDDIIENLHGFCKAYEESLKFEVIFQETGEKGLCKMDIELFKYEEGRYLLEFLRTGGEIEDYYDYFLKIKELLKTD